MSTIRVKFLDGPRGTEPDMAFEGLNQIVIGRAVDCHVLLPMPDVSHHHATLLHRDGQWAVVDSSRSGTWLNGRRLTGNVSVSNGDTLTIGAQTLRLEIPDEPAEPRGSRPFPHRNAPAPAPDQASVTRQISRVDRRSPSAKAVRDAVAGVPEGELPGPESLDDMPKSVIVYWYVHAWRLYRQAVARVARPEGTPAAATRADVSSQGLEQRLEEAAARENRLKEKVRSLEQALAGATEKTSETSGQPGPRVSPELAEQLGELKSALGDFQALVNKLADLLGAGVVASSGAGEVMGEMSALLLSMEYLIEGLGGPEA